MANIVQKKFGSGLGVTSLAVSLDAPATPGNPIILWTLWNSQSVLLGLNSLLDNLGNSYSMSPGGRSLGINPGDANLALFDRLATLGSAPQTFTAAFDATADFSYMLVIEWSRDVVARDGNGAGQNQGPQVGGTDVVTTGTWTTSFSGSLLLGASAMYYSPGGGTQTDGTGFTSIDTGSNIFTESILTGAPGSYQATWSLTGDDGFTGNNFISVAASYQLTGLPPGNWLRLHG
jgi:hypothetical protein